jgi:hypothetical protein
MNMKKPLSHSASQEETIKCGELTAHLGLLENGRVQRPWEANVLKHKDLC